MLDLFTTFIIIIFFFVIYLFIYYSALMSMTNLYYKMSQGRQYFTIHVHKHVQYTSDTVY